MSSWADIAAAKEAAVSKLLLSYWITHGMQLTQSWNSYPAPSRLELLLSCLAGVPVDRRVTSLETLVVRTLCPELNIAELARGTYLPDLIAKRAATGSPSIRDGFAVSDDEWEDVDFIREHIKNHPIRFSYLKPRLGLADFLVLQGEQGRGLVHCETPDTIASLKRLVEKKEAIDGPIWEMAHQRRMILLEACVVIIDAFRQDTLGQSGGVDGPVWLANSTQEKISKAAFQSRARGCAFCGSWYAQDAVVCSRLLVCVGCCMVAYCSQKCAKADFKEHSAVCTVGFKDEGMIKPPIKSSNAPKVASLLVLLASVCIGGYSYLYHYSY